MILYWQLYFYQKSKPSQNNLCEELLDLQGMCSERKGTVYAEGTWKRSAPISASVFCLLREAAEAE